MLTVNKRLPAGHGLAASLLRRAPSITLDWEQRQKSRFEATDSHGRQLGIFLPRGTQVRGGDLLVAEDGSLIRVDAAPQPVLVVTHCPAHGSPFDLLRAAYHLGNRHVALALQPERLLLEPDHVLAAMLRQMHLIVTESDEPFEPEGGAYAAGGGHRHGHDHDPGHAHAPGPASAPPVQATSTEHHHSDACRHGPEHGGKHDSMHGTGHADEHRHGHGHGSDHGHGH